MTCVQRYRGSLIFLSPPLKIPFSAHFFTTRQCCHLYLIVTLTFQFNRKGRKSTQLCQFFFKWTCKLRYDVEYFNANVHAKWQRTPQRCTGRCVYMWLQYQNVWFSDSAISPGWWWSEIPGRTGRRFRSAITRPVCVSITLNRRSLSERPPRPGDAAQSFTSPSGRPCVLSHQQMGLKRPAVPSIMSSCEHRLLHLWPP